MQSSRVIGLVETQGGLIGTNLRNLALTIAGIIGVPKFVLSNGSMPRL